MLNPCVVARAKWRLFWWKHSGIDFSWMTITSSYICKYSSGVMNYLLWKGQEKKNWTVRFFIFQRWWGMGICILCNCIMLSSSSCFELLQLSSLNNMKPVISPRHVLVGKYQHIWRPATGCFLWLKERNCLALFQQGFFILI